MADINKHLATTPDGDSNVMVTVDYSTFTPGGGGSDDIVPGNYELTIMKMVKVAKKDGSGAQNVRITAIVSGPSGCSELNKQTVSTHPVQMGDPKSPDNAKKNFLPSLLYSIASGKSTENAEALRGSGQVTKPLNWFEGKKCWAKINREDNTKGRMVGKIQFYLTKESFDAAPGPIGGGNGVSAGNNGTDAANDAAEAAVAETAAPAAAPAADPLDDII